MARSQYAIISSLFLLASSAALAKPPVQDAPLDRIRAASGGSSKWSRLSSFTCDLRSDRGRERLSVRPGDPWLIRLESDPPGRSLTVVRGTEAWHWDDGAAVPDADASRAGALAKERAYTLLAPVWLDKAAVQDEGLSYFHDRLLRRIRVDALSSDPGSASAVYVDTDTGRLEGVAFSTPLAGADVFVASYRGQAGLAFPAEWHVVRPDSDRAERVGAFSHEWNVILEERLFDPVAPASQQP